LSYHFTFSSFLHIQEETTKKRNLDKETKFWVLKIVI
jgi:hypothetical protein